MTNKTSDHDEARERLARHVAACLREADRLGQRLAAIRLDEALHAIGRPAGIGDN